MVIFQGDKGNTKRVGTVRQRSGKNGLWSFLLDYVEIEPSCREEFKPHTSNWDSGSIQGWGFLYWHFVAQALNTD